MFRFEHFDYIYLLILLPILVIALFYFLKKQKVLLDLFASASIRSKLMEKFSFKKYTTKSLLIITAIGFIVFGMSNPQWSNKKEKVKRNSADIFIALDISTSMYAQDISPNRLERAKKFATKLVDKLKGDQIGLIVFAGNAYLQMPLTTDYAAAKLFIKSANPSQAPTQGTAIAEAINIAIKNLNSQENVGNKGLVIITDGEDHEKAVLEAASEAKQQGLITYLIGVGTEEGGLIPYTYKGQSDYKRDENGTPVKSKLNIEMIKSIANSGGGNSYLLSENPQNILNNIASSLADLEKRELEQHSFKNYESYFQWFLLPAFILLLVNLFLGYHKIGKIKRN